MKKPLIVCIALLLLVNAATIRADGAMPEFPKGHPYAAFLNTHAFAIAQGATAEWRKMEGVAFDVANKRIYVAVTSISHGMSDGKGDIQMTENLCGAVFMGQLDDQFNLVDLKPVVVGGPYDNDNTLNACSVDAIAGPDNVFVDTKGNLWIGEDSDHHHNQFLWMWDGKELKRYATMPEGAEVAGLHVTENDTLFMNVQHPADTNVQPYNLAIAGVVTGFKAGDDFKSLSAPTADDMKRLTIAGGTYQVLGRAGDSMVGAPDKLGEIMKADGSVLNACNNPDGNMYLPMAKDGSEGYLYTNWECAPGGVSKLHIKQGTDGKWSVVEGRNVDFASVEGTWNNCNASVSPWNTGLTSEEFPPDVQEEWDRVWLPKVNDVKAHLGKDGSPYHYGYIVEMIPTDGMGTTLIKHYVMGRFSHEMALVVSDKKTVYFGDDGNDRVLYKFVADVEGDLSAGTLYAAKIKQDGDTLGLTWIKLGAGNNADIAKAIPDLMPKP
jgi:secreted PhoX family phosphatase